jgi:hypothetical protein
MRIDLSSKILGILYRVIKIREVLIPLKAEGTGIAEQAKTQMSYKGKQKVVESRGRNQF